MPRNPDHVQLTFRCPADLKARLEQTAADRCVSRNLIVAAALRQLLDELAPLEPAPAPTPAAGDLYPGRTPVIERRDPDGADWSTLYPMTIEPGAHFIPIRQEWQTDVGGRPIRVIHEAQLVSVSLDAGPDVPPPKALAVPHVVTPNMILVPIVPPFEATETGTYLVSDNGDGTRSMVWTDTVLDPNLSTVYSDHAVRMEAIAPSSPGINVVIGPRTCRQPECEGEPAPVWCKEHLANLIDHPDPEQGR